MPPYQSSTVYLSMIAIASDTYRAREFCHDFSSGVFLGLFCSRAYSTRHTVTSRKSSVEKRTKLIRSARSSLCNVRLCVCVRMGEAGRAFSHACSAWPCEQCQHCKPNVILTTAGAFIEMARLNNCWHLHYAFSIHILQLVRSSTNFSEFRCVLCDCSHLTCFWQILPTCNLPCNECNIAQSLRKSTANIQRRQSWSLRTTKSPAEFVVVVVVVLLL